MAATTKIESFNYTEARSIVNLKYLPEDTPSLSEQERIQITLKQYSIAVEALANMYSLLGRGDLKQGEEIFEINRNAQRITIERVGFDKQGNEKFYLIDNTAKGRGGFHTFHYAVSRKGTPRAALRRIKGERDLTRALELSETIKQSPNKAESRISRIMDIDRDIVIYQLGNENLQQLMTSPNPPTKEERLLIYQSLLEGVSELHDLGYIHGDLKLDNVVVIRNTEGTITSTKIIDLEGLSKAGHQEKVGTPKFYSPERLEEKTSDRPAYSSDKDDMWAVMYLICSMESRMPQAESLINSDILTEFLYYARLPVDSRQRFYRYQSFLFSPSRPSCILDDLIFELGRIKPQGRPSAKETLDKLKEGKMFHLPAAEKEDFSDSFSDYSITDTSFSSQVSENAPPFSEDSSTTPIT